MLTLSIQSGFLNSKQKFGAFKNLFSKMFQKIQKSGSTT